MKATSTKVVIPKTFNANDYQSQDTRVKMTVKKL